MPAKIFLDTDIGSDIDDAVCLAYLLANPACHLNFITTVSGDTILRARPRLDVRTLMRRIKWR